MESTECSPDKQKEPDCENVSSRLLKEFSGLPTALDRVEAPTVSVESIGSLSVEVPFEKTAPVELDEGISCCQRCGFIFKNISELQEHQNNKAGCSTLSPKYLRICPHCKKTFGHLGALSTHLRYCWRKRYPKSRKVGSTAFMSETELVTDATPAQLDITIEESEFIRELTLEMPPPVLQNIKSEPSSTMSELENMDQNHISENYQFSKEVKLETTTVPEEMESEQSAIAETPIVKEGPTYFKNTNLRKRCEGCDLIFKSISHAQSHMKRKKLYCRRPPYKCNRCGKHCKNVHSLVEHERSRFACNRWLMLSEGIEFEPTSPYIEDIPNMLNVNVSSEENPFKKPFVTDTTLNDKAALKIEKSYTDIKNENIEMELPTSPDTADPTMQSLDAENVNEFQTPGFKCRECDLEFINSYRLRKHVFLVHRTFQPQKTSTRAKPSPVVSLSHTKTNLHSMSPFKCEGGYRCPTCQMLFTYPSRLSLHLFRKGKCYPPTANRENDTKSSISKDSPDDSTNSTKESKELRALLESQNTSEFYKENKTEKSSDVSDAGFVSSLDSSEFDMSYPESNFLPNNTSGFKKIPNLVTLPKQKVLTKIVRKYRKLTHHNDGAVPFCDLCQLSFCNKASLGKHYEKYHSDMTGNEDMNHNEEELGCPFCERKFQTLKARNSHVRFGHKELPQEAEEFLKETQCDICAKAFETVSDLTEHFSCVHANRVPNANFSISPDSASDLKCVHCDLQFTTKHHYSGHVNRYCPAFKRRHGINSSSPAQADRRVSVSHSLNGPKRSKGGFMCAHCQTKFSYRTLYIAHVNRYCPMKKNISPQTKPSSEVSDMTCPYCHQIFVRRHLFETHVRSICSARPSTSSFASTAEPLTKGPWFGKQYSCWGCRLRFESRKLLYAHHMVGCSGITFGPGTESSSALEKGKGVSSHGNTEGGISKDWLGVGFTHICRGCQKRFNSRKTLHYHQKAICTALKNKDNASASSFLPANDNSNTSNESDDNGVSYVCRGCQNVYISRRTLYNHQKLVCKKFSGTSEIQKPLEAEKVNTELTSSKPQWNGKSEELPAFTGITYTCRICQMRFQSRKELYVHKLSLCTGSDLDSNDPTSERPHKTGFACKRCSKWCNSRKVLYVHQKFHCKYSKFKVLVNPGVSKPPSLLPSAEVHKQSGFTLQRYYKCRGCPEKYLSRKDLFLHHKYHCSGRKPVNEQSVPSLRSHNEQITENVAITHNEPQSFDVRFCCSVCREGFTNRRDLHLHKKYRCSVSESSFIEPPPNQVDAEQDLSESKPYVCKTCLQECSGRKLLYIHKKFNCPGRRMASRQPAETSSEGVPYSYTPRKEVMTAEVAENLKKFPNQCPFCKRQYCNPFVRDRHIRLHTMMKSFSCTFCPQTFSRSEYLTRHLQSEHADELRYQCGKCGLKYARRINCIQHLNKLHRVVNKNALVIDLQYSTNSIDPSFDPFEMDYDQDSPSLGLSVPKLTLQRTSLISRFKKRKAIWRPAVSTNFFRVVDDTPGRGIYSCDLCGIATFTKMSTLNRHWRSRLHRENMARQRAGLAPLPPQLTDDSGPIFCSVCRHSFSSVQSFVPHRLSHLNDPFEISDINPYSCEICSSVFTHHQRVQGHLMWHLRDNKSKVAARDGGPQMNIPIPMESLKLAAKKSISPVKNSEPTPNQQEMHIIPMKQLGPFACEMCSAQYSSKSGAMTHMRRFCPKRFMCRKCGQCFSNARVLSLHKGQGSCSDIGMDEHLKCRHCSLDLETVEDLGWHEKSCLKVHESEKGVFESNKLSNLDSERFNCSICKQAFPSLIAATKHEEMCLSTTSPGSSLTYHCLQCMVCNENVYSLRVMEKHALLHHQERLYVRCLPCQKLFHNLKDLAEHITLLSATLVTPEEDKGSELTNGDCLISSNSDSSTKHIGPNTTPVLNLKDTPTHPCQHCFRGFQDDNSLKVHMVVHSPFVCTVCNKEENTKEGFLLHMCLLPDGTLSTGLIHIGPIIKTGKSSSVSTAPLDQATCVVPRSDEDIKEDNVPVTDGMPQPKPVEESSQKSNPAATPPLESSKELNKLRGNFSQLMFFLVADPELMTQLGWGQKPIDGVLEDVLRHLGEKPITRENNSRTNATELDILRENVTQFLSISIKDDVLSTIEGPAHSSVDEVVSKMLGMCTEGDDEDPEPE